MKSFYTNVLVYGSKILYRGIENGRPYRKKLEYYPSLYVNLFASQKHTEFKTIHGQRLSEVKPGNIRECKDFIEQYKDVDSFKIYGNQRFEYSYISENFPEDIDWDISLVSIANIDIEVGSENGFPDPDHANEPITAITFKSKDKKIAFGCGNFNNNRNDVIYYKCRDEIDLIKRFMDEWTGNYPDIITGWNVKLFDIPYLVNRITKVLGEAEAKRLSPWNIIHDRQVNFGMGKVLKSYNLLGISCLDYIDLYRKYAPEGNSQESYKLDNIANVELGERKLSYEEYGNLHSLYRDNFQLFMEYNIRDVELVDKLEDKLKLIELVLTLAYDSKTNYEDAFTQVRMWDILISNHLKKKNIIVPPNEKHRKDQTYIGAYVKDPIVGMHEWIVSLDLNSLYPMLIQQYNISPETLIEPKDYDEHLLGINLQEIAVDSLLYQKVNITDKLKAAKATLTPNGQFFRTEKQGFLPEMMESMYNDRTVYKKKSIEAKKELEKETDPDKRYDIEKRIARYHNLQLAKKVSLNSAYGACGNQYFRFFDIRLASAITTAGQLSIRWIENKLNDYMNSILKTTEIDYVIASDTDSIYLSLHGLVNATIIQKDPSIQRSDVIKFLDKVCESRIQPFIDNAYSNLAGYLNVFSQKMQMKREALADKGIWTAKKRYIINVYNNEGVEYAKPKLKVMGLEMIKSSTPAACKDKLWKVIDLIFNNDQDSVIEFIENFREDFKKLSPSEIAFPRGVNGIKKFSDNISIFGKGTPIHVRGSLLYNDLLIKKKLTKKYPLIKEGEKIKFVYLKEPNILHSNIISFPSTIPEEFDITKEIDYNTQYEKSFVEPLKIVLDSIGWKTEKISSLENFFS